MAIAGRNRERAMRGFLQRHALELGCDFARPDFHRITGDTTAQPVQISAWKTELNHTRPDI